MNDIFISYARDDRARVEPLATALERRGWSVWWDPDIRTGQDFDASIAAALQAARCVVVVWSKRSVNSPWVKDEAEIGRRRGVLVPVRIDAVERPLGFGRLQTADLIDWDGARPHPEFDKLAGDIANILEGGRSAAVGASASPTPAAPSPSPPTATAPPAGAPGPAAILHRHRLLVLNTAAAAAALLGYVLYSPSTVAPRADHLLPPPTVAVVPRAPEESVVWPTPDDRVAEKVDRCRDLWKSQEEARAANPGNAQLLASQADCAMLLLDYIRISGEKARFSDVVDTLTPVLHQALDASSGTRAADLLAHLGWAAFLKSRDGEGGLQPESYYRRALEQDADNPFANAMWGHWILWQNGSLAEAQAHFTRALRSGREQDLVRRLQLAGLMLHSDSPLEFEAVRVANEMRGNQEPPPTSDADRRMWSKFWNIYYDHLANENQKDAFLAVLPPAEHLATFRWLFPEHQVPRDKLQLWTLFLATFQERNGERSAARSNYEALRADLTSQHLSGTLLTQAEAGVRRLSGQ
jgi:hypothetical protein